MDDVDFVCYCGHVNLLPAVLSLGLGVSLLPAHAQFTPPLRLDAFQEPDGRLRLQSTTAVNFILEETDSLTPPVPWRAATATPDPATIPPSFLVQPTGHARFFRALVASAPPAFTQIESTSPVAGETGVSVKRETIFRFTAPLAAGVLLSRDNLHAEAGGRSILSRSELSSDRLRATLFLLEDLPAGAIVRVTLDAVGLLDAHDKLLDADGDEQAGGRRVLEFETFNATPIAGTAIIGRVFASELVPGPDTGTNAVNKPLAGVTITVDGFEQTLRALTDINGNFTLNNCPAGRFFVHVDGRTAVGSQWPGGAYYPVVGKAWEAKPGVLTNRAAGTGEIFLPLIAANTLQAVSATQDTAITFPAAVVGANPALAGVQILVPANSLFADNGTRGGKVGIAAVPPDRLPEPLPPGLQFPLVITVQTDGAQNFDRPVPARFPNLPDPATGVKLPPGAKTGLWGFNHDTGRWELQGPMTISADGNFADSDPGVGIRQPGWWAPNRGSPPGLPPPPPQPPKPPGCEGKGSDYADDLLDLASAVTRCIGDLTDAADDVRTLIHLATELREGFNNFSGLMDHINESGITVQSARDSLQVIGNAKGVATDLANLIADKNPISKAAAQINCAENLLNAADNICGRHVSADDECDSLFARGLCAGISTAKATVSVVNLVVQAAEGGLRDLAVTSLCASMQAVIGELGAYLQIHGASAGGPPQLAGGRKSAEPLPGSLRAAFQAVRAYEVALKNADAAIIPLGGGVTAILSQSDTLQGETLLEYFREFGFPNNAPFVIRIAGQELHDVIGAPGGPTFILLPNQAFELHLHLVSHNRVLAYHGTTAGPGVTTEFSLKKFTILTDNTDGDRDGLGDIAEGAWGTLPNIPDTDGDGLSDGAEIDQGSNPLDSAPVRLDIVASADTAGQALDLTVGDDLAVVALNLSGVAVLKVQQGTSPILLAQVDTPGQALGVARSGNRVLVGDGTAGMAILDLTEPAAAYLAQQIPSSAGASIAAVDADDGVGYAGSNSGQILAVDLGSGVVLMTAKLPKPIQDLRVNGDQLYALAQGTLYVLALDGLTQLGSVATPGNINTTHGRMRLFVDGKIAYAVHNRGYNTIDVRNPATPVLLKNTTTAQQGWKQIVLNGSGLGVAAVSPSLAFTGPQNVLLYDTSDPLNTDVFLAQFVTPGIARAVAIYKGQAYVADHLNGMQVVNYLAFDTQGKPPAISLTASFPLNPASVEKGRRVFVRAEATDDVQVRDVEFYHDGTRVFTDGSYPFEHHFTAPPSGLSFKLRAKATDTGGNVTWTDEITVALTADVTAPRLVTFSPAENSVANDAVRSVTVLFDGQLNPATLVAATLQVFLPGPDLKLGTTDDQLVPGTVTVNAAGDGGVFTPAAGSLASGKYRAVLRSGVQDPAGNPVIERPWNFTVTDRTRPIMIGSTPALNDRPEQPVTAVTVFFSEPLHPATGPASLTLTGFGADDRPGTADDVIVVPVSIELLPVEAAARFTLPAKLPAMRWRGELSPGVADFSSNLLFGSREWHFMTLVRATLAGRAIFADGSPANGASVRIHEQLRPLGRVAAGGFSFPSLEFTPGTLVTLDVHLEAEGRAFLGRALNVQPVPDGITDFGTITLREVCTPQLAATVLPPSSAPVQVNAFVVFDDGSGPALYAAGKRSFAFVDSSVEDGVYRRRGLRWERVGGATAGSVLSLAVFDNGSGPALYAGGGFVAVGGIAAAGIARWDGQQWRALGDGVRGGDPRGDGTQVRTMAVYDAGTGPRLYVAGLFETAGGIVVNNLASWNGLAWSAVADGIADDFNFLNRRVNALAVFDEGKGPRLFAAGQFQRKGSYGGGVTYAVDIVRWDGSSWSPVGEQGLVVDGKWLGGNIASLAVAAVGGAPRALFAAAQFGVPGGGVDQVGAPAIARWNGTAWSALAGGPVTPSGSIVALLPWTDASGTSLVAGGSFLSVGGPIRPDSLPLGVARWTGTGWTALDGSTEAVVAAGDVLALAAIEGSLFVGGVGHDQPQRLRPEDSGGRLQPRGMVRWDGQLWQPADDGLDGQIQCLAEFDSGQGPETYLGGNFTCGDGQRLFGIARMDAAGRLHSLGKGMEGIVSANFSGPGAMLAHNDGSGEALYIIGRFDDRNGGTASDISRWNGTAWSSVGDARFLLGDSPGPVSALAVFDDGSGPSLYVGGWYNKVGTKNISCLARWNGVEWLAAGNPGPLTALAVFDDGVEPALYLAGHPNSPSLKRWNGRTLSDVGNWATVFNGLPSAPSGLAVMDTLTGPMLHVAAGFFDPIRRNYDAGVARWNGVAWQRLPPVPGVSVFGFSSSTAQRLEAFDDGFGPGLYVIDGFEGRDWVRWNGAIWEGLPEGPDGALLGITSPFLPVNGGATPSLLFGGYWTEEVGNRSLLRWSRPVAPCP